MVYAKDFYEERQQRTYYQMLQKAIDNPNTKFQYTIKENEVLTIKFQGSLFYWEYNGIPIKSLNAEPLLAGHIGTDKIMEVV